MDETYSMKYDDQRCLIMKAMVLKELSMPGVAVNGSA